MVASDMEVCDEVLVCLKRITRAIDLHSRRLVERYGLTVPQLIVLKELTSQGEMPVGRLAAAVSLSQATVTGILHRLKLRQLVVTNRDQTDRRRVLVHATQLGEDTLRDAPSLLQERFVSEFRQLEDWEQTLILSSLQRVVTMMEAERIEAAPVLGGGLDGGSTAEDQSVLGGAAADPAKTGVADLGLKRPLGTKEP
jgi:DNA-binding MarR family transcriptional regulator